MLTWVVGSGGLLGSAFVRVAESRSDEVFMASAVPWGTDAAASVLALDAARFFEMAAMKPWSIAWAAGSAVVASDPEAMTRELDALRGLLEGVRAHRSTSPGAVFLASSAGGAYGASSGAPYSESSPVQASGPYGELKLAQESLASSALAGVAALYIGRIANLYGPGQNPTKPQGLVHALCRAAAHRRALNLYVPLETLRDYVYADDVARVAHYFIDAAIRAQTSAARTVVIGSGRAVSIAELVNTVVRVTHRKVPMALGMHPSASQQALDLRLTPTPLPPGCAVELTSLDVGVRRTFDAIVGRPSTS